MIEYNVAVMELHYRAGKLLELNNVYLSEGPWDPEAEYDVLERGDDRRRSAPTKTMLHTAPEPFVARGGFIDEGPPIEAYGPAQEGWINDYPAAPETVPPHGVPAPPEAVEPSEPSQPPPWDLDVPEWDPDLPRPAPAEPMLPPDAPPVLLHRDQNESPIEGPQLPPAANPQFLLPVPSAQPTTQVELPSPVQQISHHQEAAARAGLRALGAARADGVWDLGNSNQSRHVQSMMGKQDAPETDRKPKNSDELRAEIRRKSAEARSLPTRTRNPQGKR